MMDRQRNKKIPAFSEAIIASFIKLYQEGEISTLPEIKCALESVLEQVNKDLELEKITEN